MGERERQRKYREAEWRGEVAYRSGYLLEENPYKISTWGLGCWWVLGWKRAKQEADAAAIRARKV